MRRRQTKINVDMFPFLSVLCSVIGVLMLFILLIVTTRIIGSPPEVAQVSPYSEGGETGMSDEEYEAARREIEDLSGELSERRKEADHLMDRVGQLRELLAVKNEETLPVGGSMLHGVDLLDHPICRMVPSGGIRVNKKPQFIEVDSEGYLVHPAKERFFLTDLPGMDADMRPGHQPVTRMENLIHNAYEKRDQEYLIFLVRPSGATAFRIVLRYLRLKYPHAQWPGALSQIDVGWEPFAKEWLLLDEQTATRP